MPKKQKSISVRKDVWKETVTFYEANKKIMNRLGITSASHLLQVAATMGFPSLKALANEALALTEIDLSKLLKLIKSGKVRMDQLQKEK